jgi:portal protein
MKKQLNAIGTPKSKGRSEADTKRESDRKFIETAMKRWRLSSEATADNRRDSLEDFKFRIGEQWPEEIRRKRGSKVALTINRVASFCNQVTNEQRQQRPAGTVNPVGDQADKETAEILQGMVRHIEVNCDAEIADDIAFEHMVIGGFGWIRMWSEYIDDDPDNEWGQEIKVGAVPNPFTVYDDPAARHPLKIDAKWRFFVEDMLMDDYKEQYGELTDFASLEQFRSTGDSQANWITKESIRIAEYYHIEYEEQTIYQLADGSTVTNLEPGDNAIKTRKKQIPHVMLTLMNAVQKLEEHEVPGVIIPSFPVLGYSLNVDGKQYLAGLVRTAKDPARAYNYHLSAATQAVALAPKMPFIATAKQTENFEREWQAANTGDLAVLHYTPDGEAPPPQRETAEPPIQAISHLLTTADTDMKAVTGLFDPSLGQKSPDQSGKAIVALQRQGNVATSNFSDNLARTKREVTRTMLRWIPIIYDTAAVRRIIKPDGTVDHVGVYNSKSGAMQGMSPKEAQAEAQSQLQAHIDNGKIKKIYDIGVGRYDVTVSVGPSYQTKRQEQAASIMALISAYPELMHVCGDILINDLDFEQAKEIAERVKRTIPPNILGPADGTDPEADNARMSAELQQMMQQHSDLAQQLEQATQVIQQKQVEAKSKMDIERLHAETQVTVAEINTKSQQVLARTEYEHDMWKILHGSAHDLGMQADQNAATAQQQQAQAAIQAQAQTSDQDHTATMAAQSQAADAAQPTAAGS